MSWKPQRTLAESEALLTAPGSIHEVETVLVDGRLQRVYKNLWPSLREFWLSAVSQYSNDTYVVYEDQRLTYTQVHNRAVRAAEVFRDVHGIRKDLIGAVSVLVNAWLPHEPLMHCLVNTQCKLVIFDPERADLMQSTIRKIQRTTTESISFLVFDFKEHRKAWEGMKSFSHSLNDYRVETVGVVGTPIVILPEDNATLIFTSGTTGLPKGVLSTQRQFLTNVYNVLVGGFRASIRRGEESPKVQRTVPQKGTLVAMMATMTGMKIVLTRKWDVEEAVKLIKSENVSVAGGVPSMVTDLTLSPLVGHPLEGLLFGGAPAPATLVLRANKAFPTATMIQGYGLTETNSIAVSLAGEDYIARPSSTGRASPVNEIQIVNDNRCVPAGVPGEVWLRGPNIMKCYWRDPEATSALITQDGWLKTGDVGYLDEEGFLYIKDRIKDIIIRGGENVDSVTVENALYDDPRILEAAAVGVPDERLGELVAAIVSIRPDFKGQVTEDTLIAHAKSRLPKFAVPVMIIILNTAFERTPSGKILKGELRKIARSHWELRRRGGNGKAGQKDLFFHGLSVFSRLRPDLIAEHIRTKSTFDVCVYLDALHAASLRECPNVPPRKIVEPAIEVSERWVENEEFLATELATIDGCSWSFARAHADNSRAQTICSCPGDGIHKSLSSGLDTESNGYLSHLDLTCLMVMESLIRETEPGDIDLEHLPSLAFTAGSTVIGPTSEDPVAGTSNDQSIDSPDNADQLIEPKTSKLSRDVENELYRQSELRRRLRKRLYMRRKRAEQVGRAIVPASIKLRPGRPKKHRKPTKPRQKKYSKGGHAVGANQLVYHDDSLSPEPESSNSPRRASSERADDDTDMYEAHSLGGTTKPYRVKKFFQENGMDGHTFSSMDLDFFHLSTLRRLLRLYASLDESPRDLNDISISAQTIQLMFRITKEFVYKIIRHAIITKEQEIRLKRSLRVWKYDRDEITSENVAECLNSMGLGDLSKEKYFTQLLERTKRRSVNCPYSDEEPTGSKQPSSPTDSTHAPFILPPSLLWCSLPHHQQFFLADDELLPEPIDEEQLKKELAEEDAVDMEDEIKSKEFEAFLWERDRDGCTTDTSYPRML
ncbi:hypothetical protein CVT25_005884 [Psilocybe cyanescens]|uniref:AMP-dependent synthetase/ligase domain-containing protein n=1 Tax=Psilocybe cyanescens TaxID=93625 RepID=A0A409VM15_PSICY|nr:hypothetical protein CVT25_005884 [Psilocybe cyanescens]